MSISAPLTTLMVVINELSSYLLILSSSFHCSLHYYAPSIYPLSNCFLLYCSPLILAILSPLLFSIVAIFQLASYRLT